MNDWVAVEISHERYTFNTDVVYHVNKTLEEVCDYHMVQYSSLKLNDENGNSYIADECISLDDGVINDDRFVSYHIRTLLVVDAMYLWKTALADGLDCEIPFIFGNTNKKFGLIDFRK